MDRSSSPSLSRSKSRRMHRGFMLFEALVGMVIFSVGVLGLVGFQSTAIKSSTEAKGRSDAAFLANQLIARMWTDRSNLPSYALNAAQPACALTAGNASVHPPVVNWLGYVQGDATNPGMLPGADALAQQVSIDATSTVTVTLCWNAPGGDVHRHVARSRIRFN